jgi:hypothetical protein
MAKVSKHKKTGTKAFGDDKPLQNKKKSASCFDFDTKFTRNNQIIFSLLALCLPMVRNIGVFRFRARDTELQCL